MEKDNGSYEEIIDLTNCEDVGEPDLVVNDMEADAHVGASKIRKRKISKWKSVGKAPKAVHGGVVKKGKQKAKSKYFIVAEKQGGDDGTLRKGSGKRRLVLSKEKGKKKDLGGHKKKGEKSVVRKEKVMVGHNNGKATVDAGTKQPVDRIHLRVSLWSLHRLIHNLSVRQREDVTDMGFGAVLGFNIRDVPTRLSYWLLDNFDEDERVLNIDGKSINITRETVRDVLGLPMGDVTVEVRDEADYRHPLVVEWKRQFGKKERYLHGPVEQEMYTQQDGGWMFKLNFLVLYFTSIGEANKNATVNLRFLRCINNEHDIPKFDWCSYVVECLVRTKRNWIRWSHYPGPIIVLLILYAHSITPRTDDKLELPLVNNWTVDLLNQLEEGMTTRAKIEEVKRSVSSMYKMAGDIIKEADDVLDDAIAKYPQNVELVHLKDSRDVLFGERKCGKPPKDSPKPKDSSKMEEPTDAGCRTPERDVNMDWNFKENDEPFPYYTQMYGSPSAYIAYSEEVELQRSKQTKSMPAYLDDIPSFDLKFTQGFDEPVGETQKLLEYLTTYDSQTEPNVDVYHTPEHEKVVPAGSGVSGNGSGIGSKCGIMGSSAITNYNICEATPLQTIAPTFVKTRTRRNTNPGEFMCSPYIRRAVHLKASTTSHEQRAADCLFSGRFAETDILFRTDFVNGPRGVLESLCPGIHVASGVVDIFTKILNHAERFRDPLKPMQKVFCDTTMVNEWDVDGSDEKEMDVTKASARFVQNMESILRTTEYKSLANVELVFFPIIQGRHFYVVCMHMKNKEVHILDNMSSSSTDVSERYGDLVDFLVARFEDFLTHANHPLQGRLRYAERKILRLGCMTKQNFIDCGVFTMRHMETYLGGGEYDDLCCLRRECKEQQGQLNDLRIRYAAKILLSDINQAKSDFEVEADEYRRLPSQEKQRLGAAAFERLKARVTRML